MASNLADQFICDLKKKAFSFNDFCKRYHCQNLDVNLKIKQMKLIYSNQQETQSFKI